MTYKKSFDLFAGTLPTTPFPLGLLLTSPTPEKPSTAACLYKKNMFHPYQGAHLGFPSASHKRQQTAILAFRDSVPVMEGEYNLRKGLHDLYFVEGKKLHTILDFSGSWHRFKWMPRGVLHLEQGNTVVQVWRRRGE
ncbi:unnamed protein product [Lepidochelys kempii]